LVRTKYEKQSEQKLTVELNKDYVVPWQDYREPLSNAAEHARVTCLYKEHNVGKLVELLDYHKSMTPGQDVAQSRFRAEIFLKSCSICPLLLVSHPL